MLKNDEQDDVFIVEVLNAKRFHLEKSEKYYKKTFGGLFHAIWSSDKFNKLGNKDISKTAYIYFCTHPQLSSQTPEGLGRDSAETRQGLGRDSVETRQGLGMYLPSTYRRIRSDLQTSTLFVKNFLKKAEQLQLLRVHKVGTILAINRNINININNKESENNFFEKEKHRTPSDHSFLKSSLDNFDAEKLDNFESLTKQFHELWNSKVFPSQIKRDTPVLTSFMQENEISYEEMEQAINNKKTVIQNPSVTFEGWKKPSKLTTFLENYYKFSKENFNMNNFLDFSKKQDYSSINEENMNFLDDYVRSQRETQTK